MAVIRPPQFDRAWQRRRRWQARWRALRPWLAVAALVAISAWLAGLPGILRQGELTDTRFVLCGTGAPGAPCVIDGDTAVIGQRRIRFTGFDAPELDGACEAERRRAREARGALLAWLNRGPFHLGGGDDPPRDRYGRELRQAWRVEGAEEALLADAMLALRLARGTGWGAASTGWCAPA